MILSRKIHVVVGERLLLGGFLEPLILRTSEEVERVPPDLALWDGWWTGGGGLGGVPATQPGRDVVKRHLLYEGGSVPAVVPPLEYQDEAGDEGTGPCQSYIELRGQSGQEHCRHPEILTNFQRSTKIENHKGNLQP